MNRYKLGNITKKYLLKTFKNSEISKKKFSFTLLNNLFNAYECSEYLINYYDTWEEDRCNWQDVESSWLSYENPDSKTLNKRIYKDVKQQFYYYDNKHIRHKINMYKRNLFIGENNKYLVVIIPLRDIKNIDIVISFNKSENWLSI